jgi:hypothetical protein
MARVPGDGVEGKGSVATKREHRYVYNGTPGGGTTPYGSRPNKRGIRRKVSTFNIILLLFGLGGGVVFYVHNIITINRLSAEIDKLRARHDQLVKEIAELRSDVSIKSSWDVIGGLAAARGLRPAQRQPEWITIDRDRIGELDSRIHTVQRTAP